MIRIAGVILPPNKHIWIALTGIYGIGKTTALNVCRQVKIDSATKVKALTDHQLTLLQEAVQKYEVEGDLRRHVAMNIKRLVDIKCYRGLRHKKGLPVRGQRTRTNARTRKGRKRQSGTITKP